MTGIEGEATASGDAATPGPPAQIAVRLWDLPVRIVHWSLVLLIPALWGSAEFGRMDVHRALGYAALSLLLFRLYWGVAGSAPARFASFVRGPMAILAYLRGGVAAIGHNPLGALSVIALLGLLGLQIGLGLFAQDTDGLFTGPLADLVSYETSDAAGEWHEVMFNVLLAVIALHVGAVLFYLFVKRDNLIGPMVTGRKRVAADVVAPQMGSWISLLAGIAISMALTAWIANGAPLP